MSCSGRQRCWRFTGSHERCYGPKWAALATLTLSISLPLVFFSRDTYTEPLSLMFVFATLTMLQYAVRTQKYSAWLLVGLSAGAAALLRVDMYVFQAAIGIYGVFYLMTAPVGRRAIRLKQLSALAIPAVTLGMVGWYDLSTYSSGYYHDLHNYVIAQLLIFVAIAVLAVPTVAIAWRTDITDKLRSRCRPCVLPELFYDCDDNILYGFAGTSRLDVRAGHAWRAGHYAGPNVCG